MIELKRLLNLDENQQRFHILKFLETVLEYSSTLENILVPQLLETLNESKFDSYHALLIECKNLVSKWSIKDKATFVNSHPRIGEQSNLSALSAKEQAARKTPEDVLLKLSDLNSKYEVFYPQLRFITFVNGRTRAQIIPEIEGILNNTQTIQSYGSDKWLNELNRDIHSMWLIAQSRLNNLQ